MDFERATDLTYCVDDCAANGTPQDGQTWRKIKSDVEFLIGNCIEATQSMRQDLEEAISQHHDEINRLKHAQEQNVTDTHIVDERLQEIESHFYHENQDLKAKIEKIDSDLIALHTTMRASSNRRAEVDSDIGLRQSSNDIRVDLYSQVVGELRNMVSSMEEALLARIISGERTSDGISEKIDDILQAVDQANLQLDEMNERIDNINEEVHSGPTSTNSHSTNTSLAEEIQSAVKLPVNGVSSRLLQSPQIINLIRGFYYSPYRLWLVTAIENAHFIQLGNQIEPPLRFIHRLHHATMLELSNAAMTLKFPCVFSAQQVKYPLKYALSTATSFGSKLGQLEVPKYENLAPRLLPLMDFLAYCSEVRLSDQVLNLRRLHPVFMTPIAFQKLALSSRHALAKVETIFRSKLGRLAPPPYCQFLWIYYSDIIFRVLAIHTVFSAIRRRKYCQVCALTLISLCFIYWGFVSVKQPEAFAATVLSRRTRRLIRRHYALT